MFFLRSRDFSHWRLTGFPMYEKKQRQKDFSSSLLSEHICGNAPGKDVLTKRAILHLVHVWSRSSYCVGFA